jgi:hypothetical protein
MIAGDSTTLGYSLQRPAERGRSKMQVVDAGHGPLEPETLKIVHRGSIGL